MMNASDLQRDQTGENDDLQAESEVLAQSVAALRRLDKAGRERVLQTLNTFFGNVQSLAVGQANGPSADQAPTRGGTSFSEDRALSPKAFILDKKPVTDVERVTCLAYYLTHYRDSPEFRTIDLSKLNTEAAQIKFSNPAVAVDNATRSGLLVATSRGNKMISANGELYVQALPDRDAARAAIAHAKPRRKKRQRGPANEASENA